MSATTTERRPVFGQFAWVSAGRVFAALLQAASLILAARLLQPAAFGHLAAVLALTTVVQTGVDFGVSTFISRERAANPSSGAIATALRFNNVTSLGLILGIVCALWTAGHAVDHIFYEMLPLALWASGERNADARLAVAFADGDARVNVTNLLLRRLAAVLMFILFDRLGAAPVIAFSTASAIAAVSSSIFANLYIRRRVTVASSLTFRELLGMSWPYWVTSLATQLRNLDVVVVSLVAGPTQASFYSTGSRLTSPLLILPTSLASVLLPATSREVAAGRPLRPLVRTAAIMILVVTVLYTVVFLLCPALVRVMLGPAYLDAIPVVRAVIVGLPFAAGAGLLMGLLQGLGKKHLVATAAILTTAACLSFALVGALLSGALGAAIGLAGAYTLQSSFLAAAFTRIVRRRRMQADAQ